MFPYSNLSSGGILEPEPLLHHSLIEKLIREAIPEHEPIMNEFLINKMIGEGIAEADPIKRLLM